MRRIVLIFIILVQISVFIPLTYAGTNTEPACDFSSENSEVQDCIFNDGMSPMEMRAAYAEMQINPSPSVSIIPPNAEIIYQRRYRRLHGTIPILNAPGGAVIREIQAGFNYATYINYSNGYYQVNPGEWVSEQYAADADVSEFAGVEINAPLARPFFWMLAPARPSTYPGGPENPDAVEIKRYELRNIYGTEIVDGWDWYLVGPDQWIQQIRVAKVIPVAPPPEIGANDRWIAVDLFEQTMAAYEGDKMVFATLISSGLPQWSTNEGLFQITSRWTHGPMTGASGLPDFYFIEDVPWIMYYDGDIALHGTFWHDRFGYRQSHGCVNLSIMDSKWIHEFTAPTEYNNAWVYVYSSGDYRQDLPDWARR